MKKWKAAAAVAVLGLGLGLSAPAPAQGRDYEIRFTYWNGRIISARLVERRELHLPEPEPRPALDPKTGEYLDQELKRGYRTGAIHGPVAPIPEPKPTPGPTTGFAQVQEGR